MTKKDFKTVKSKEGERVKKANSKDSKRSLR